MKLLDNKDKINILSKRETNNLSESSSKDNLIDQLSFLQYKIKVLSDFAFNEQYNTTLEHSLNST